MHARDLGCVLLSYKETSSGRPLILYHGVFYNFIIYHDVITIEIKCTINNVLDSFWNHPSHLSLEKLSSMGPVTGAKMVEGHCYKSTEDGHVHTKDKRSQTKSTQLASWSQSSSPENYEEIKFYLSYPVCGTFYSTLSWLRGEGNGTPLQYSCLENLMDGEAW